MNRWAIVVSPYGTNFPGLLCTQTWFLKLKTQNIKLKPPATAGGTDTTYYSVLFRVFHGQVLENETTGTHGTKQKNTKQIKIGYRSARPENELRVNYSDEVNYGWTNQSTSGTN